MQRIYPVTARVFLLCAAILFCSHAVTDSHEQGIVGNTAQTIILENENLVAPNLSKHGKLAIIMDDIGYNLPLGKRAVELPGAITYAVLPHTPLAKKLAFYAHEKNNKEIIVHMPMQSLKGKRMGPGGLHLEYGQQEFVTTLRTAIKEVPFARGLSNHMGSHLTALPDRMDWLMQELREQDYYFLDSKTTSGSTTRSAAYSNHVPYLARDIFLDHDSSPDAIALAFKKALQRARNAGLAVVIAHPYRSTLAFLERELPSIAGHNIQLIKASEALFLQQKLAKNASNHPDKAASHSEI